MTKVETVEKIIKDNIDDAKFGIFCTRNILGDTMINIYDEDGVQVDICYDYGYFEIFGLTPEEFNEVERYYYTLRDR